MVPGTFVIISRYYYLAKKDRVVSMKYFGTMQKPA